MEEPPLSMAQTIASRLFLGYPALRLLEEGIDLSVKSKAFLEDNSKFLNQTKIQDFIKLLEKMDLFISKFDETLKIDPSIQQKNEMVQVRSKIVANFKERLSVMYGTPKQRANRIISQIPEKKYRDELSV